MKIVKASREFKYIHLTGTVAETKSLQRLVMQSRHIQISEAGKNYINITCMDDEMYCSLMVILNNGEIVE